MCSIGCFEPDSSTTVVVYVFFSGSSKTRPSLLRLRINSIILLLRMEDKKLWGLLSVCSFAYLFVSLPFCPSVRLAVCLPAQDMRCRIQSDTRQKTRTFLLPPKEITRGGFVLGIVSAVTHICISSSQSFIAETKSENCTLSLYWATFSGTY